MDTRKENVWVNPIELDDRDVQNELGQQSSQIIEPMESLTLREPVGVLRAEDPLKHEQLSDIPEEPESMVPRRYTDRRDSSYQKLFGQTKSDKWTHQSPTNKKDDLYGDSNRRIHYQPDERTPFEEWMHSRGQDYTGDATIESHGTTENHETRRRESSQAAEKLKTLASNAGAIGAAAIGSLFGLGGEQDSRFSKPVPPLNQHHKSSHFDGDYNMPSPGRGISLRDEESSPDKSTSQDDRGISLDNSRDESSPGIVDYVDSQRSTGIDNTWSLNDPSDEGTQPISDHSDQWDESQQSRNLHSNNNTGYNLASDPLRDNETLVTSHDKYADAAYQAVHGTTQRPLDIHKALPRQLDSRQDESRQGDSRQAEKGNKVLHEPNAIDVTHPGSDEKEAQIVDYDPIPQYYDAMPISDSMDKPNKVTGIQGNWFDQTSGDQEPGYRTNPNTRTNKLPRCEDVKEPEMHGQNPSFYSNPNHGSDRFRNLLDENNQPPHKEDTLKSIVAGAGAGAAAAVATVGSLLGINHSGREHDHEQQGDEQRQGYGQQQGHGQQQGLGNGDSMFQKSRLAPHNFDTGVLAPERGGSKDLMYDVLTPNRGKMDDALTSDSSVSPPVVRRDVDAQKQAIQEQRGDEHRPFVHRDVDAQKQAIQDQRGDDQRRQVQRDSAQRLHDQRDNDQRHQDQRDDAQRLHDQRSDAQRHQDQRDDAQRLHDQRSDAQKLHDQRGDAQRQAFHDQRSDVQRQAFQDQRSDVQRQALRDQRGGVQNHQNPPFTQAYVDHPNENKSHEHYEQPEESKQRQRDQVPVQSQRKFSNRLGNNDLETSRQQMYRQQQQQQAAQEMKPMSIDHHPTEGPKMRNFATNTPATTASAHPASYLPGTQTEVFHPMQHPDFDRVDPDIDTHREEKDKRFYGFTHAATSIGTDPFSKGVHYSEILPSDEYPTRRRSSLEHHVTDIFGMHSGPVAGGHHKDHSQGNRFSGYHEGLNQGNRFGDHNEDYNQGNRFGDHNEDYNQGNRFGDHNQDHSHGKFTDKLFGGHKEDQSQRNLTDKLFGGHKQDQSQGKLTDKLFGGHKEDQSEGKLTDKLFGGDQDDKKFAGFTRAATSVGTTGSVLVASDNAGTKGHVIPSDTYPTKQDRHEDFVSTHPHDTLHHQDFTPTHDAPMRQKDANIPPSKNFAGFTRAATSVGTAGSVLVTADEPGVKGHVVPSDSYPTRTQEEKQLLSNDISRKRGNSTGSYNGDYGRTGLHDRNYSQYSDLRSPSQEHPTNSTRFNQEPANSTRFTQEHPEESISSNRATHHQIVPDSPKTQQRRMSDHHHDPRVNSNTHPATYFPETTQLDRQAQDQARKVSQDRQHPLEQSAHPATYERNNEYDNNPFNDQSDNHHFNNQSSLNNQSSTTHPATYYPESSTLDKKSQKMADRSSQQNEQSADDQLNESRYYGTQNSGLGSSVDDPPIYDGVRSRQPESSNEKVRVVPQEEAPEVPQRSNAPEVSQRTAPEVPQRTTERTAPEVPERTTQRTSQPELAQRTTQRTSQPELAQRTTQRTSQPELAQRATQPTSQPEVPQRTTQPELAERTTPHTAGNERRSSLMEKIQVGKGVIQKNMGKFLNSNNMQDKGKFSGLSRRE